MTTKKLLPVAAAAVAIAAAWFLVIRPARYRPDPALAATLDSVTADYRKIIVLMDGAERSTMPTRAAASPPAAQLFCRKQHAIDELAAQTPGSAGIRQLDRYLTEDPGLHDADKLAFLDLVEIDTPRRPLLALRDNLQSIQLAYREEVTRIFSQFATRGARPARARSGTPMSRYPAHALHPREDPVRIRRFAPRRARARHAAAPPQQRDLRHRLRPQNRRPHLRRWPAPQVHRTGARAAAQVRHPRLLLRTGREPGHGRSDGEVKLLAHCGIAKKVLEAGHLIANHSYSHPCCPSSRRPQRNSEIDRTNVLLEKVAGRKPEIFRAPYGARNKADPGAGHADGLRSVMWNIDSLDWADPMPESIAMRVLHELNQKQKGIILFHDIHKQSVMALSPVIEELQRQDYTFLRTTRASSSSPRRRADHGPLRTSRARRHHAKPANASLYRESWAADRRHQRLPELAEAAVRGQRRQQPSKRPWSTSSASSATTSASCSNGDATRQRIMQVLGDEFTDSRKIQREDRVFFFFAGHGATRTFEDGRQIGFIVPVDADRANYYSTAISMTSLREAGDLIPAKHIYFVMDSCYSGLALSRGNGRILPRPHVPGRGHAPRRPPDPHRRRRGSAGGRRRSERPLRLHLGAASRAWRVRPIWMATA